MKIGKKYKIEHNETQEEFMDRCVEKEMKNGKSKNVACVFCANQFHNSKSNSWRDDKFIFDAF